MTDKLNRGVVEILTPIGPRYLRLTFWQRLYFVWMFRNFSTLPQQVLSRIGLNMIEGICARQQFVRFGPGTGTSGFDQAPVIGTVERYQVKLMGEEPLPTRRPPVRITEDPTIPYAADRKS